MKFAAVLRYVMYTLDDLTLSTAFWKEYCK